MKEAEEEEVMWCGAVSRGMRKASRSWAKQGMDFPLEPLEETSPVRLKL